MADEQYYKAQNCGNGRRDIMTRKIYIGNIGGSVEDCKDKLQRKSEERLLFEIISVEDLKKKELSKNATKESLKFYIPALSKFYGQALYVPSTYVPKLDIDTFFSVKTHKNLGPIIHFVKHDIWFFDCASPEAQKLNIFYVDTLDPYNIKNIINIETIENI